MATDNKISGTQPHPPGSSTFNQPNTVASTQVNVVGDATLNLPSEELVRQISEALKPVRKTSSTDPRRKALIEIENEFSGSVKDLHLHYIVPRVQDFNPPEEANSPTLSVSQESAFEFFDRFVSRPNLSNRNGHHCLFVLGDAGMGKTSLLVMLKCRHLAGGFRTAHDCSLMKLGRDTLARIDAIEDKANTVLLLDSLDEDPVAHEREAGSKERLLDLLPRLGRFHAVIITCRTQFFPEKSSHFARDGQDTGRKVTKEDVDLQLALMKRRFKTLLDFGKPASSPYNSKSKSLINVRGGGGPVAVILLVMTVASNVSADHSSEADELLQNLEDFINHSGNGALQSLDAALVGDSVRNLTGNDSLGTWAALQIEEAH